MTAITVLLAAFFCGAQVMPQLSVSMYGDQTIQVSWPAPSAAFSLQEASTFGTPAAWQTSGLPISSNNGILSVFMAATNQSRFFRLAWMPAVGNYITNGLVAWWKLNDDAGTNAGDSSGGGNNLALTGWPTWSSNYLTLNGSTQYGDAGTNALESLDQHDKTVCAWINKNGNSWKGIVDKSFNTPGVAYGGWGFWIQSNGKLEWSVQDGLEFYDDGFVSVATNTWTFVTVVWHSTALSAEFYVDGLLNSIVDNGAAGEQPSEIADLQVGDLRDNSSGGAYAFDGSIRQVGIYNRALSAAEIGTNFLATEFATNVTFPNTLYYKFTEHAQTNPPVYLADSSTHGGTTGTVTTATVVQWVENQGAIPGSALHFNGVSTYIDTGNSGLFNFTTNSFTINIWMLPLTANGFVMANGFYHGDGWFMSVGDSYQINFGSETFGGENVMTTVDPVNGWPSTYDMVTVTRNGSRTPLIYVNGAQVATTGSFANPASSEDSLVIGASKTSSNYLDGDIALLQIWNTALSSSDVANLYLAQSSGSSWP
jgi:hypothetical protein